jgi:RimJ/RimL family protein N-acetyltransferase
MNVILETERLRLRELTLDDSEFVIELLNSPGWLQYIGDRNVRSTDQAAAYLQNGPIKSYQQNGFGLCLVQKKDNEEAIGLCGIIKRDNLENPDIGFAFLPRYHGKGYAFEVASATMIYAIEQLKIATISAITVPYNSKSIRLLENLGLQFIRPFYFPGSEEELLLYSN